MTAGGSRWWMPHVHADRRPILLARARMAAAFRAYFATAGFVEVETAVLARSPGNETHLHALATDVQGPNGASGRRYLRTSPEFACKKLLAAGEPRIVEFARVFRDRERGPLHHPEFTLIEWYRAREPYEVLADDCAALLAAAAETTGNRRWRFRGREADPLAEPERLTVAQAFLRHSGIDIAADMGVAEFAAAAKAIGVATAADDTWGDVFSRVLTEKVEPHLGIGRMTVLSEYPSSQSALARPLPSDPRFAERFELYVCGVELANAFGELTDAAEQRRRLEAEMAEKDRIYGTRYPLDEDFLAALATMPQACGIALGFDRVVMLATGAERIDQAIWTPHAFA